MIQEINTEQFDALDPSDPKLVKFYSKNCGPCKMLSFVLRDVDKLKPDFNIYTIDFDENQELKERLEVKGFPTILLMRDGKEVKRITGLQQKPAIIKAIAEIA